MGSIRDRFDQEGYQMYSKIEQWLVQSASGKVSDEILREIVEFYNDDFNQNLLEVQGQTFAQEFLCSDVTLPDIISKAREFSPGKRVFYSEIIKLVKPLLVMPASNASSERSFSSLRFIKSYLRNSMGQERLNNLLLLYIHSEDTGALSIKAIADEFVETKEGRGCYFGIA